jgi:hypothetical protein
MPNCSMCKKSVTWAAEAGAVVYGKTRIPVDAAVLCRNLTAVVQDLRSSWPPVTSSDPLHTIVRSLCESCWKSEATKIAAAEAKPSPTYLESAAKTTAPSACCASAYERGVFINVDKADYRYFPSEGENADFCLSTTVHELMHYLSAGSCGLQVDGDSVNFDECMTDYFAMKTYFRTFEGRKYVTNYGDKSTFFKATKKAVHTKITPSLFKDDLKAVKKDWPPGMVDYVKDYVEAHPESLQATNKDSHNLLKQHMARAFVYYLVRTLPMWYFAGPTATSDEAAEWFGKGATFTTCQQIVTPFVPKNNLGNGTKIFTAADAPGGYTELWNLNQLVG